MLKNLVIVAVSGIALYVLASRYFRPGRNVATVDVSTTSDPCPAADTQPVSGTSGQASQDPDDSSVSGVSADQAELKPGTDGSAIRLPEQEQERLPCP